MPPGGGPLSIVVARSTDTGKNWTQVGIPNPTNNHKNHLAIDVNSGSVNINNVYVSCATINSSPIRLSTSTDRGQSFSDPMTINGTVGTPVANAPNLAVGPDGELYATWIGQPAGLLPRPLGFNKSTDGGLTWSGAVSVRSIENIGSVKGIGFGGSLPSMAVDRSNGPRRGWIYIVFPQPNPSTPDIFLIRSSDGGNSWSDPIKVNQDNSGKDQWLPWITVDPSSGTLFVVYYDSRSFSANDSAEVYISYSNNGGDTYIDQLVSDVPFKPSVVPVFPGYGGAYIGIAALNDVVWPCWYDNRTGVFQVYTSRVLIPSTSVREVENIIPTKFILNQNYPNPFNPSTKISWQAPVSGRQTIKVYDVLGKLVNILFDEYKPAGSYEVEFDATYLPSGVYVYQLKAGDFVDTKKMILMK